MKVHELYSFCSVSFKFFFIIIYSLPESSVLLHYFYVCGPFQASPWNINSQGRVKNGFFIEAGAFDFEEYSNTLYFEVRRLQFV